MAWQFRPTLIIGLGGSGTFVIRRLKKRLLRLVQAEIPPAVQLLAFDTDIQRPLTMLEELSPSEFHRFSNFAGGNYVTPAALSQNPSIASFWKYKRLNPGFVQDGAKQHPPVGRLAFFVHFEKIQQLITLTVNQMFKKTSSYTPPPNVNSVDVYVIGSSCGGTGAGMFFDCALLARQIIDENTCTPILQAHVFLPSCFGLAGTDIQSLQTNALAFMKTLEALQAGPIPSVRYPTRNVGGIPLGELFSRVHLLSGVDTAGIQAEDAQSVYEKVAMQLDLEISSASARQMRSAIDNSPPDFNLRPQGRLATYSSYGAAQLAGTPDFARLAVLPVFVGEIVRALTKPVEAPPSAGSVISNRAFAEVRAILDDDTAAFASVPGYENEVNALLSTEDPVAAAHKLAARIDSLAASLSFSWLPLLDGLGEEIRTNTLDLFSSGIGGVSRANAYLVQAQNTCRELLQLLNKADDSSVESANTVVTRVDKFFKTGRMKKDALIQEGLPYLRLQTLIRVRKAISAKVKPAIDSCLNGISTVVVRLANFDAFARNLIKDVESHSREEISRKRATLGASAVAIDLQEVESAFNKAVPTLLERFFVNPLTAPSLKKIGSDLIGEKRSENWGSVLVQVADDFLSSNLSTDVALPVDWVDKAVAAILECQPMVQFVAEHLNTGPQPKRLAIARVYGKEAVQQAIQALRPDLTPDFDESREPGTLEATSMVLNFALHQLQELWLIKAGSQQFSATQPEQPENRYAWRGPTEFWKRIEQLDLFPLSPEKQAFARVLAVHPPPGIRAVAVRKLRTYELDGQTLQSDINASWYTKHRELNERLVSGGHAEQLWRDWNDIDPSVGREHLARLRAEWDTRVKESEAHPPDADDWDSYVSMLREESAVIDEQLRLISL